MTLKEIKNWNEGDVVVATVDQNHWLNDSQPGAWDCNGEIAKIKKGTIFLCGPKPGQFMKVTQTESFTGINCTDFDLL